MEYKDIEFLIGKTIVDVVLFDSDYVDDEPYMVLYYNDDTMAETQSVKIGATYGGYTGKSEDEYPAFIYAEDNAPIEDGYKPKVKVD